MENDEDGRINNPIDQKVDEIWEKVYQNSPLLMDDWIKCFSARYHEGKGKSKQVVKMTLTHRQYQTDRKKNFLWRLMSSEPCQYEYVDTDGYSKDRSVLAMIFMQLMVEDVYFEDFLATTKSLGNSELDFKKINLALSTPVSEDNTSLLHNAAILGNVPGVRIIVEEGKRMGICTNHDGYTPLHFAAMAIHPKPEIAKLLIESVNGKWLLDQKTNYKFGHNTALHLAAANVNIKEEFIQQFQYANWKLHNSRDHTPFHVAAKSNNMQAIIYMLNTFSQTNDLQDYLQNVDLNSKDTLIKLCARKGNSNAVALLIELGADVADGVLYEIVLESVRNPRNIQYLIQVYNSVVDNVVTWRNLRKAGKAKPEPRFLLVMGSDEYEERFRKTMLWLLTSPSDKYGNQSVLECALSHGAVTMVWEIIHTRSVFRLQDAKARRIVNDIQKQKKSCLCCQCPCQSESFSVCSCAETKYKNAEENWTVFDVTNFTEDAYSSFSGQLPDENGEHTHDTEENGDDASERTALCCPKPPQRQTPEELDELGRPRINFEQVHKPEKSYLTCLLFAYDQWKSSNILSTQPFSELIQPYITLKHLFYLVLGLLQLIVMLFFTVHWMPTTCSIGLMFNVSATGCSSSTRNNSGDAMLSSFGQQRSQTVLFWVVWPLIFLFKNLFMICLQIKQSCSARSYTRNRKLICNSKDLKSTFLKFLYTTVKKSLTRKPVENIFCCTMFVWLYVYFWSESHESYVLVTSTVLLFGWITNVSFFGAVRENVSIFTLVLQSTIKKDIVGFMVFFVFSVVGFSFAMHAIRMSMCMPNQINHWHDTLLGVLFSAFRIGDFFDSATTDSTCVSANGCAQTMFKFVYFGYVCATVIVLLNILIAMLNNRYARAKQKAGNVWRFEMLLTMTALNGVKCLGICPKLIPDSFHCKKDIKDKNGMERKRYYLLLPVPFDEQLRTMEPPGSQGSKVISRSIRT